jgi:hypothetical protein
MLKQEVTKDTVRKAFKTGNGKVIAEVMTAYFKKYHSSNSLALVEVPSYEYEIFDGGLPLEFKIPAQAL